MVDQVNLKWNDFEENVKIAFKENFQKLISIVDFSDMIYILLLHQCFLKGTVSLILSDPPCKECNSRFTTVPKSIV